MNVGRNIGGLLAVVAALVWTGCGSGLPLAAEVQVGMESSGGQCELPAGRILVVSLRSNPSTGYSWGVVEHDESILQSLGEPAFQADSELPGSPGTETFRFVALRAGQVDLRLDYRRAWEEGVPPVETFTLRVVVQ